MLASFAYHRFGILSLTPYLFASFHFPFKLSRSYSLALFVRCIALRSARICF